MPEFPSESKTHPPTDRRALLAGIGGLAAGTFLTAGRAEGGPLNPPAAPASTPGPEPRIAINTQAGPASATYFYHIEKPGSYYLTGDLGGSAGRSGILITADCVSLDLNGYCMTGNASSNTAIISSGDVRHVAIFGGNIKNWPGGGINLRTGGSVRNLRVERVIVTGCGSDGISLGNNALVLDCVSQGNAGIGIRTGDSCIIRDCVCRSNNEGIVAGTTSIVSDCVARENEVGIAVGESTRVEGCMVRVNSVVGIRLNDLSLCHFNTCMLGSPAGIGIEVVGFNNRLEGNHCGANATGMLVTGSANIIARNTCSANGTNWNIAANNVVGPILDRRSPDSAAIVGNSAPDSTGTTHPWANFTH